MGIKYYYHLFINYMKIQAEGQGFMGTLFDLLFWKTLNEKFINMLNYYGMTSSDNELI